MTSEVWDRFENVDRTSGTSGEIRLDPTHPLDLFLCHTENGDALLLKNLPQHIVENTQLSGISLSTRILSDSTVHLELCLLEESFQPMFRAIVDDLVDATRDLDASQNSAGAMRIVNRVERWRRIFDKANDSLLSRKKIIGLFGELSYLKDVMIPNFGAQPSLAAWRGPFEDEQDFALASAVIEVKTSLSTRDGAIHISSENQLDVTEGPIFLAIIRIATSMPDSSGDTLKGLVDSVRTLVVENPFASSQLEVCLFASGYTEDPAYEVETFAIASLSHLEVTEDFPKIIRRDIPDGVLSVKYSLSASACHPFICGIEEVIGKAKDV